MAAPHGGEALDRLSLFGGAVWDVGPFSVGGGGASDAGDPRRRKCLARGSTLG